MRAETLKVIQMALDDYKQDYIRALVVQATKAHIVADVDALDLIKAKGDPMDWAVINEAAKRYATEYGRVLAAEGATVINGQRVPWLERMDATNRAKVVDIIERGIARGKYPGTVQGDPMTASVSTIADDLREFFHARKSHAETVARTEVGRVMNNAKLNRWEGRGYSKVRVKDGDGANPCPACKAKNGQVWSLAYARTHELEHPNCVRSFVPVPKDDDARPVEGAMDKKDDPRRRDRNA